MMPYVDLGASSAGGVLYQVLNRANHRNRISHKPADYEAFLKLLVEPLDRTPCRHLGLCLMPNHWHLVLCPRGGLSRVIEIEREDSELY